MSTNFYWSHRPDDDDEDPDFHIGKLFSLGDALRGFNWAQTPSLVRLLCQTYFAERVAVVDETGRAYTGREFLHEIDGVIDGIRYVGQRFS